MVKQTLKSPKIELTACDQRVIVSARCETIQQVMSAESHQQVIRHICRAMINLYLMDHKNGNSLGIL